MNGFMYLGALEVTLEEIQDIANSLQLEAELITKYAPHRLLNIYHRRYFKWREWRWQKDFWQWERVEPDREPWNLDPFSAVEITLIEKFKPPVIYNVLYRYETDELFRFIKTVIDKVGGFACFYGVLTFG